MPTTTPPPPNFAADLAVLNEHRLARDWTFLQLSEDMRAAGWRVHPRTLHYIVRNPDKPTRDRTAYKICRYVATLKIAAKRLRKAAGPASSAEAQA